MKLTYNEVVTVEKTLEADWAYAPVSMSERLEIGNFKAAIFPNWADAYTRAVVKWFDPADESGQAHLKLLDMMLDSIISRYTVRELAERVITEYAQRGAGE